MNVIPPASDPALGSSAQLRERLRGLGPALLKDGAMGTQILNSGFDGRRDLLGHPRRPELLNLTRPEQVQAIHESYLDAGARVLFTNTLIAAPRELEPLGRKADLVRLHRQASQAARAAVNAWCSAEDPGFVLGSIGPTSALLPEDFRDANLLERSYAEQIACLAPDVAGLAFETATDLRCLRAGLEAARRVAPALPVLVAVSTQPDGSFFGHGSSAELVELAREFEVDLVGVNCVSSAKEAEVTLRRMAEMWPGALGAWPNALDGSLTPAEFATALAPVAGSLSLRLVGGCCGTRPAHIASLYRALSGTRLADTVEAEE